MTTEMKKSLTNEEKKYLLSVERGDIVYVRRTIQNALNFQSMDINCVDNLGRGAIMLAIDSENLEMLELLVTMGVKTHDALLHAINAEFIEAVEFLLERQESIDTQNAERNNWEPVDDVQQSYFMPDVTPLILAAHRNNYEIIKILLDRGATLPMPHDIKCGCDKCLVRSEEDSLRHSLSRVNIYRALSSPSLISLSSPDPILTAFHLSWEMRKLSEAEPEYKSEYIQLRKQCQQFAVNLLRQSSGSQELSIILNQTVDEDESYCDDDEPMHLSRLKLALKFKQKQFVAHPYIQQLLVSIWYEGVPGFRRRSTLIQLLIILAIALAFPIFAIIYLIYPRSKLSKLMRKPFIKFLMHATSYVIFLIIVLSVSQRTTMEIKRAAPPNLIEFIIILYVIGFIREELVEMREAGFATYIKNIWNVIDFSRNLLFTLVYSLRLIAYVNACYTDASEEWWNAKKETWQSFEIQLICEGLFASASIFSALKLIYFFSINPHLGPLQISLGKMVNDIVKIFSIYILVIFAFSSGLYQLLGYFSTLECYRCDEPEIANNCYGAKEYEGYVNETIRRFGDRNPDSCRKWRSFSNFFETLQSLFWAAFGLLNIDNFELTGVKDYTRFWGLLMFGSYAIINVTVLLTLLIAMMSNTYAVIHDQSDTEWKFARTKLWMSYFEGKSTLPPPFNIIPIPLHVYASFRGSLCGRRSKKDSFNKRMDVQERDYRYTTVIRALVWRYVAGIHRKSEENTITEDNFGEVKSEITSFRYELLDILDKNGMETNGIEKKSSSGGGRMKMWERRLMKDFKVVPVATSLHEPPPPEETTKEKFRRVAKVALFNSNLNKWRAVVHNTTYGSQLGLSGNMKKKSNIKKVTVRRSDKERASNSSVDTLNTSTKVLDVLNF